MGEDFVGKVGESDIIKIPVKDPRISSNDAKYINVIFDFTDFFPPYKLCEAKDTGEEKWWYYFPRDNTVHVLISEDIRKGFINLMTKKSNGGLTKQERRELETYTTILDTTPHVGAQQAVDTYPEYILGKIAPTDKKETKKEYRTKKKAGMVDEIPSRVPVITNKTYQNAMTLNMDNKAYLQPMSTTDNLVYENGQLLFEGFPATAATLKRHYTMDGIENFDLPLLRVFYGIILNRFSKTWKEDKSIEDVVTLYYPDLAKMLGKSPNINKKI